MESCEFGAIRKLLDLSNKVIRFNKSVALKLKDKLFELHKLPSLKKFILLLNILEELAETTELHYLCEQGFSSELNHRYNERINIVYKFIEMNYRKRISLSDISKLINMSEEYFSRFFKKIIKNLSLNF